MRLVIVLLGSALLLAGCGNDFEEGPPDTTLEFPASQPDQGAAAAAAVCTPYGKTAKLKDIEARGTSQVAVYTCG